MSRVVIIGGIVLAMCSSSVAAALMMGGEETGDTTGPTGPTGPIGPTGPAPKKETFYLGHSTGNAYGFLKNEAATGCQSVGAQLATEAQVIAAQENGADWCATGWVSDSDTSMYPITTRIQQGCGNGSARVVKWTPETNKAGVNCYGVKPSKTTADPRILPFSESKWSRYE